MGKRIKGILTGVLFIIVGAVICGVCVMSMGFDMNSLRFGVYKTVQYDVEEEFNSISIAGKTEDISFALSEDGKCSVVCFEEEKSRHSASVTDDTLYITASGDRNWIDFFSFWAQKPRITVYLPGDRYEGLNILSNTGDTVIPAHFSFSDINIRVDTGDIDCSSPAADNVSLSTQTGDVRISTQVKGGLNIFTSTGDVQLNDCDAGAIYIKTDIGDVSGTLLTDKSFEVRTDIGDVHVPDTSGGKCSIISSTGDVDIRISDQR